MVLEAVVRNYILTAAPTGSRFLSKQRDFDWSPATIRNIMGDLEEKGYIEQPHKSAGRIPTDRGYRLYVDHMVKMGTLPSNVKMQIREELLHVDVSNLHIVMEATSKALSKATNQLGIILSPKFYSGIFRHLNIHRIDSQRYLLNLAIDSGFVKTLVVELATEVDQQVIETACDLINSRYSGLSLQEIFLAENVVFSDVGKYDMGIIRLFIPSIQKMLEKDSSDEVFTDGKTNILLKPEFFNREQVGSIIEILEEKNVLMHLFNKEKVENDRVVVSIGGEIKEGQFSSFSIVKTRYRLGGMNGSLGVIGPKRMPYPFLISAVDYTSKVLEDMCSSNDAKNE